jgi:hypothetical protein
MSATCSGASTGEARRVHANLPKVCLMRSLSYFAAALAFVACSSSSDPAAADAALADGPGNRVDDTSATSDGPEVVSLVDAEAADAEAAAEVLPGDDASSAPDGDVTSTPDAGADLDISTPPPGPCNPNPCVYPPDHDVCAGTKHGPAPAVGICASPWDNAMTCTYPPETTTDCAAIGAACGKGQCLPAGEPIDYPFTGAVTRAVAVTFTEDGRYDFDGDGALDNGFGRKVAAVMKDTPTADFNKFIKDRVDIGVIKLVAEVRQNEIALFFARRNTPLAIPTTEFVPGTNTPRLVLERKVALETSEATVHAEGAFDLTWRTLSGTMVIMRLDDARLDGQLDAAGALASATLHGWGTYQSTVEALHESSKSACPCFLGRRLMAESATVKGSLSCAPDATALAADCFAAGDEDCSAIALQCYLLTNLYTADLVAPDGVTKFGVSAGMNLTFTPDVVDSVVE